MELSEVMKQQVYVIVGDTVTEEKYAYRIKSEMLANNYNVYCVGKELASIDEVQEEIDIIDLCIHPVKGLEYMKNTTKTCKCVVLQPGASSDELETYLTEQGIPFLHGCLLKGLALYVHGTMNNGG